LPDRRGPLEVVPAQSLPTGRHLRHVALLTLAPIEV
jgi:hypothetical protein